jgi:hypothetical protein
VLARALVAGDDRPQFGVPAWATTWWAWRLTEWLIDRPSGRVVAMQTWSPSGFARRYRIAPAHGPLPTPLTRPRLHIVEMTPRMTEIRCGPRGNAVRFAYGFGDGIRLARRVARRLEGVPALRLRADGRSAAGRRFTVTAAVALEEGRVRATAWRRRGSGCWEAPGAPEPSIFDPPERARVVPLEDAFLERPRRRGRLLVLRAHTDGLTVDSLIDPRDLRLVEQRWAGYPGRGRLRLAESAVVPPPPADAPRCRRRPAA